MKKCFFVFFIVFCSCFCSILIAQTENSDSLLNANYDKVTIPSVFKQKEQDYNQILFEYEKNVSILESAIIQKFTKQLNDELSAEQRKNSEQIAQLTQTHAQELKNLEAQVRLEEKAIAKKQTDDLQEKNKEYLIAFEKKIRDEEKNLSSKLISELQNKNLAEIQQLTQKQKEDLLFQGKQQKQALANLQERLISDEKQRIREEVKSSVRIELIPEIKEQLTKEFDITYQQKITETKNELDKQKRQEISSLKGQFFTEALASANVFKTIGIKAVYSIFCIIVLIIFIELLKKIIRVHTKSRSKKLEITNYNKELKIRMEHEDPYDVFIAERQNLEKQKTSFNNKNDDLLLHKDAIEKKKILVFSALLEFERKKGI